MKKADRTYSIVLTILAVIVAVLVGLIWIQESKKVEPDAVYPMANARIEWSGAGYSGIYGR